MVQLIQVAIVIILYFLWRSMREKKIPGSPPEAPGAWPLFGHIIAINRDPLNFFINAKKACGGLYTINILWTKLVIVADKDLYASYFRSREDQLSFRGSVKELYLEDAIFGTSHSNFTAINIDLFRKIMGENYSEDVRKEVERNIEELPDKGKIDLVAFGRRTVCNVTAQLLFGTRGSEELITALSDFERDITKVSACALFSLGFVARYYLLPRMIKKRQFIIKEVAKLIAKARVQPELQSVFLRRAFALQDNGQPLSDETIANLSQAAFFAGVTNTALGTANVLTLLTDNPVTLENLKLNKFAVLENPELQKWMMECARVSQGFFGSMRIARKDVELGGYIIPKGTWTIAERNTPYINSEQHSIPPVLFAPERWIGEGDEQYKNYVLNWGAGIHLCPGMFFALAEMKYMLTTAVETLHIEPSTAKPSKIALFDVLFASFMPQTSQLVRNYEKIKTK